MLLCFTLRRNVPFVTGCGSKILAKCREDSDWWLCLCVCAQLHKLYWLHFRLQSLNKLKNSVWAKYMGGPHGSGAYDLTWHVRVISLGLLWYVV